MKFCLLLYIFFVLSLKISALNYYIDSENGDDSNPGVFINAPWKSYIHLSNVKINPGDSILLKRGCVFNVSLELTLNGSENQRIVFSCYGDAALSLPVINGNGKELYGLLLKNSSFCIVENIEITNTGEGRGANRMGVYVLIENFGESKGITLNQLFVHDVNGCLVKDQGSGAAIMWANRGDNIKSRFVDFRITNCHIKDCGRNGIYSSGYFDRDNWFPNLGVYIGHNLIEGVPGDGIVPIGCDGAIVEYNIMRDCPAILTQKEATAGIWPWSCDNTLIQFNEVSGHNSKWDGQGFDSDYNCRNTIIQYNYSHDNAGGFLLVCNDGNTYGKYWNRGTKSSVIRYNISVNDGTRSFPVEPQGWLSAVFHLMGPIENTMIYNNLIIQSDKENDSIDNRIVVEDYWGPQLTHNTQFQRNIFYNRADRSAGFDLKRETEFSFLNNIYIGVFNQQHEDTSSCIDKNNIKEVLECTSIDEKVKRLKQLLIANSVQYTSIYPGELWLDDSGDPINAHGGGMVFAKGKYYWFGEKLGEADRLQYEGVNCYSSNDLYNWKKEGIVLAMAKGESGPFDFEYRLARPKVIFNQMTQQYVMFFRVEKQGMKDVAQVGIATSNGVTGPYTFIKALRPNAGKWPRNMKHKYKKSKTIDDDLKNIGNYKLRNEIKQGLYVRRDYEGGQMSRDLTVFVDADGKAYQIYSSEENMCIHIAELTDDYQGYTGKYIRVFPGEENQAPIVFKHKNKYYMLASAYGQKNESITRSFVSESIWGPWKIIGNSSKGLNAALTFNAQGTYVLPVKGKEDTFIFMVDKWNSEFPVDSRYIWLPIQIDDERLILNGQKEWKIE